MINEAPDILLVEDNPNDAELTLRALKKNNVTHKVSVLTDGAEALDFLFASGAYEGRDVSNRPKVIFLDLKLPKISGLEVLKRIKQDERTKVIPVVVLTSSQEDRDMVEGYKLGVNSYILKPPNFYKFTQVVTELGLYWLLYNKPLL